MHKDPPPTLLDPRRNVWHVVNWGVATGAVLGVIAALGLDLVRATSAHADARPTGDATQQLVDAIPPKGPVTPTPAASAAIRYR